MNFTNIFQRSYWFAVSTPPFAQTSLIVALLILIAFFMAGVILRIISKRKRENPPLSRGLFRLARPCFFVAILGLIFTAFRQMGAAVLSARFWMLLIDLIGLIWFVMVARMVRSTYAAQFTKLQEVRKYQEYLPKKKGK